MNRANKIQKKFLNLKNDFQFRLSTIIFGSSQDIEMDQQSMPYLNHMHTNVIYTKDWYLEHWTPFTEVTYE